MTTNDMLRVLLNEIAALRERSLGYDWRMTDSLFSVLEALNAAENGQTGATAPQEDTHVRA